MINQKQAEEMLTSQPPRVQDALIDALCRGCPVLAKGRRAAAVGRGRGIKNPGTRPGLRRKKAADKRLPPPSEPAYLQYA